MPSLTIPLGSDPDMPFEPDGRFVATYFARNTESQPSYGGTVTESMILDNVTPDAAGGLSTPDATSSASINYGGWQSSAPSLHKADILHVVGRQDTAETIPESSEIAAITSIRMVATVQTPTVFPPYQQVEMVLEAVNPTTGVRPTDILWGGTRTRDQTVSGTGWQTLELVVTNAVVQGMTVDLLRDALAGRQFRGFVSASITPSHDSTSRPWVNTLNVAYMALEVAYDLVIPPPVLGGYLAPVLGRPVLRQLQRGGRGGIGGIPRLLNNPTVRDTPRRGSGSVL